MSVTQDQYLLRVGVEGLHEPIGAPVGANVQLYYGTIALISGGTGVTQGYLKNADSPASTDRVIGMIGEPAGGTFAQTGPGILGGTTDGAIWVDCLTGSFLLLSGTGSDAITETNAGSTCYVVNSVTAGLTNGGSTRPTLGIILPITPDIPTGYVPVKLTPPGGG